MFIVCTRAQGSANAPKRVGIELPVHLRSVAMAYMTTIKAPIERAREEKEPK